MSNNEWQVLNVVKTLDEVTAIVQQHQVSKFRTSNLKTSTKYSYRCSQYRKYPLCRYEIQVNIPDNNPDDIKILSRNVHSHQQRNTTTRLPSPVRESVAKYVKCGLTQTQMKSALSIDHANIPLPSSQLSNIISYNRRKNNPEIFSVYDLRKWCNDHKDGGDSSHSTFVPYYSIDNVDNIFVLFTTKQLIQQTQFTTLLQVDATYKITWNELPLLVFGASDADRHFRPFGIALVSSDESSACYEQLFNQLRLISAQECNRPYLVNYLMADGALGIASAQQAVFPQSKRLMCWAHVIRKCREHRKLVPKDKWNDIDADIHALQLSFSDDIFNCGSLLLTQKWSADPAIQQFQQYFFDQWITKLPLWYEGAAFNLPSTNNGCESLNGKIKQQYTLRNKLHLSSFLPKVEQMLNDWSTATLSQGFTIKTSISSTLEVAAFKWSNDIDKTNILHWFDTWYIVPSSNAIITPVVWLQMYQLQQWKSFDEFVMWQKSCWLVSPLNSCTCPSSMKLYSCKHSVGLAILFKIYEIRDKTRCELLGKRRGKGRSKKVRSALML